MKRGFAWIANPLDSGDHSQPQPHSHYRVTAVLPLKPASSMGVPVDSRQWLVLTNTLQRPTGNQAWDYQPASWADLERTTHIGDLTVNSLIAFEESRHGRARVFYVGVSNLLPDTR